MQKRFVSIWFRYLATDWFTHRQPSYKNLPLVLRTSSHGRMVITAANAIAVSQGISTGMVLADARALVQGLQVEDDQPDLRERLLKRIAEWCIRFTPVASVDLPDGIILDASGCTHLWGGEEKYIQFISNKIRERGFSVRIAMADTIGVAWAVARFSQNEVITIGQHTEALMQLPPEALRIEIEISERLHKLGLHKISQVISLPRQSLRRRFGQQFLTQLDKALGYELELIEPIQPTEPYQQRLSCIEPIATATGIAIALQQLLESLCTRLQQEQKGVRTATFTCYRVDRKVEQISIATNRPSHHVKHLFQLFEIKLSTIEPALGIELFVLEASNVEDHLPLQKKMWSEAKNLEDEQLAELLDRISNKVGTNTIHRYLPDEHYWPERSIRQTTSLQEKSTTNWRVDEPRPVQLLSSPVPIEVTAPIPDYPPMVFRYQGSEHRVVRADGPERIEQEWWIQQGQHRDYYRVEDESGNRYWLFRLGHYHDKIYQWFLHGFFA